MSERPFCLPLAPGFPEIARTQCERLPPSPPPFTPCACPPLPPPLTAYIEQGARRFHPWEPFVTFSYDARLPQQASKGHTAAVIEYGGWNDPQPQQKQQQSSNGYDEVTGQHGYFSNWDGQADGYAFSAYYDQRQQQEQQQDYEYYGEGIVDICLRCLYTRAEGRWKIASPSSFVLQRARGVITISPARHRIKNPPSAL